MEMLVNISVDEEGNGRGGRAGRQRGWL